MPPLECHCSLPPPAPAPVNELRTFKSHDQTFKANERSSESDSYPVERKRGAPLQHANKGEHECHCNCNAECLHFGLDVVFELKSFRDCFFSWVSGHPKVVSSGPLMGSGFSEFLAASPVSFSDECFCCLRPESTCCWYLYTQAECCLTTPGGPDSSWQLLPNQRESFDLIRTSRQTFFFPLF